MQAIRTLTLISLIITCYYFVYYFYLGITNPIPIPGDSWDYHIPISESILDGSFLHPDFKQVKQYFPGSSEAINAIFLFFHIPLTISNLFAIAILAICCYKLARTFHLQRHYSLLFALTFVTVNAVVRWMNAVSVDVWIAIYFILLIILLEKPEKKVSYFLKLGFLSGMLVGSKYNAVIYLLVLLPFYFKTIISLLNFRKILVFLIPFSLFGLFWYIRNYIAVHNPFYPLTFLGFPGQDNFGGYLGGYTMWNIGLRYPLDMLNAAFGEYKFWLFSIFIVLGALIHQFVIRKEFLFDAKIRILSIGTILFFIFLTFPTDQNTWIMVSSFRYSYPAFIPLMLGVFLIAAQHKKELFIGYISVGSMINVLTMAYYPKLLIFYIPLAFLIYYFFNRKGIHAK